MSWNPFAKTEAPAPRSPIQEAMPDLKGELYSDENAEKLLARFGTLDLKKIEEIIQEKIDRGELIETSDN